MSGISTGIGAFSGINSQQLIEQLLAIDSRPKLQAQRRVQDLQFQQAAFLDLNSRLAALRTAAETFRTDKTFQRMAAASSDETVLTASATLGAPPGAYSILVDRLVSTQQLLSRGFADSTATAVGATSFTVESARARLDRDVALADLNGGTGVERGKVVITDSGGRTATVDLSKAVTVDDVLEAINSNGTAQVKASVSGGKFVITDNSGGSVTVADATGSTTATSLGIAGSATGTINGSTVYYLASGTSLASLNDGNGVSIKSSSSETAFNFTIKVNSTSYQINVGEVWQTEDGKLVKKEGAATTVGAVLKRINDKLGTSETVRAEIAPDGKSIRLVDTAGTATIEVTENSDRTAKDLGLLAGPTTGTVQGKALIATLNSVQGKSLNGGTGIAGDGVLNFTTRSGVNFSVTIDPAASLSDTMKQIETASGVVSGSTPRISVSLNPNGNGLQITDNTGGSSNLIITGTSGADTAASLGISTGASGVASAKVKGTNLQMQYVSRATLLNDLNGGRGVGLGTLRITDTQGISINFDINDSVQTVGGFIDRVNSLALSVKARVNAKGDGIEIYEDVPSGGTAGAVKLKIEDVSGAVAKGLGLAGEATAVGATNKLDGSAERTITFAATDTLRQVTDKINAAGAGISAAIIRDGAGSSPFRLSLSSTASGRAGRVILETGDLDLGLRVMEKGEDSRAFYGSSDPAKAILLTSSTNKLDSAIAGVTIDLKAPSTKPVTITVARNDKAIETAVTTFVKAFNDIVERIDKQTSYDAETKQRGALLGESSAIQLRAAIYSTVQGKAIGVSGQYQSLAEVGITVGKGGRLELDEEKLTEAITEDPAGVEALFAARTSTTTTTQTVSPGVTVTNPNAPETFSSLGVPGQLEQLVKRYLDGTDGVLTSRSRGLDSQIQLQKRRIEDFDARLDRKRTILERQFLQMERAIAQLQTQQGALGALGG